jgi:hypothetical protein
MYFGHDLSFWIALFGAALVRVLTSPFHSVLRAVVMVVTSVFVAWVFTDPVVDYLHLDPTIYKAAIGALLALTADGVLRGIFKAAQDPGSLLTFWRRLRFGEASSEEEGDKK